MPITDFLERNARLYPGEIEKPKWRKIYCEAEATK